MIRNVVLVRLKAAHDAAEVKGCPGTVSYTLGDDLSLRGGNWSFAIVADFTDAGVYVAYDQDARHNELRGRLRPMAEQIARVQFEVPSSRWPGTSTS